MLTEGLELLETMRTDGAERTLQVYQPLLRLVQYKYDLHSWHGVYSASLHHILSEFTSLGAVDYIVLTVTTYALMLVTVSGSVVQLDRATQRCSCCTRCAQMPSHLQAPVMGTYWALSVVTCLQPLMMLYKLCMQKGQLLIYRYE